MNQHAQVTSFIYQGHSFTNVAIRETGVYRVPSSILSKPILATALDVVSIAVDRLEGCFSLEAIGGVVTTELLTEDVRLEIYPKVSFDAMGLLLHWSTQPTDALLNCDLPIGFNRNVGFFDAFVSRFLSSIEDILRHGWYISIDSHELRSESLQGALDAAKTMEHIFTRLEVSFHQRVYTQAYSGIANRVLKTALVCLAKAAKYISEENLVRSREILVDMPNCSALPDSREALIECEQLIGSQGLDGSRYYYYTALNACVPILEAISRMQGGSVEDEHIPIRISMPLTFESAIRNLASVNLGHDFVVAKGRDRRLYASSDPSGFNPTLEPDIVISRLRDPLDVLAVFDVKYKERPTASDHHQLAAYLYGYGANLGGFITLGSDERSGVVSHAKTSGGENIFEYAISASHLAESVRDFLEWLETHVALR
jgi:hypothetical protein